MNYIHICCSENISLAICLSSIYIYISEVKAEQEFLFTEWLTFPVACAEHFDSRVHLPLYLILFELESNKSDSGFGDI